MLLLAELDHLLQLLAPCAPITQMVFDSIGVRCTGMQPELASHLCSYVPCGQQQSAGSAMSYEMPPPTGAEV